MLRHPAEVVGSRDVHYSKNLDADKRRQREVANVAGWINVALVNEQLTRGGDRAFLHYSDLIAGWREPLREVSEQLRLGLEIVDDSPAARAIDDFIDVSLHRTKISWDDLDVPVHLQDMAEGVWQNLSALADRSRGAAEIARSMDTLRVEYDTSYAHAVAMSRDHIDATVRTARRQAQRRAGQQVESATANRGLPKRAVDSVRRRLRRTN
jgi:hypothetical protein